MTHHTYKFIPDIISLLQKNSFQRCFTNKFFLYHFELNPFHCQFQRLYVSCTSFIQYLIHVTIMSFIKAIKLFVCICTIFFFNLALTVPLHLEQVICCFNDQKHNDCMCYYLLETDLMDIILFNRQSNFLVADQW